MNEMMQIQSNLSSIASFQDFIFQSKFENVETIIEAINANNLLKNKHSLIQLLITINQVSLARNKCISTIFQLFDFLSKSMKDYFEPYEITKLITNLNIVKYLFQSNIIGINEIISISRHGYSAFLFFSKILEEYAPSFYSKMTSRSSIIRKSLLADTKSPTVDLLIKAIETDDLSSFQSILSQNNLSINTCITFPLTENNAYTTLNQNSPSLIEYAAFHGSTNIFKFLTLNDATFPDGIMLCAIAGGSYEMIHLVESKGLDYNSTCIKTAIQFHQNDVVSYILDHLGIEINSELLLLCIEYYNIPIILNNIDKFKQDQTLLNDSFIQACKKSSIDLVKMFNALITNQNPQGLASAIENGNFEIVRYLIETEKYNVNIKCKNDWTPLFFAVRHKKIEIINYLLSFSDIDINAQDNEITKYTYFVEFSFMNLSNTTSYCCN